MQSWSISVGIAVLFAIIVPKLLTIANVGSGRQVLLNDGRAISLGFNHEPDERKGAQQIQAKGRFVMGGRIAGVLPVFGAQGPDVT
jgi:serine/threonine protein phosphatase PrpC